MGIEPTTSRFYSHTLCRCATTGLIKQVFLYNIYKTQTLPRQTRGVATAAQWLEQIELKVNSRLKCTDLLAILDVGRAYKYVSIIFLN